MNLKETQNELISVIIPSYNSGKFLGEAIESVVNQTYKNIEIIVINDGSTDNTEEIAKKWQKRDERVRYLKHKENKGPSAARNTGIKNSRGEYIAFLDDDDEWLPEKLERVIEIPPKTIHALKNIGKETLYLVSAQDTLYNPKNPDTFPYLICK